MPVSTIQLRDSDHFVTYTNAQGSVVTAPRDLILSTYAPATPGRYPVIVYSHGHGGSGTAGSGTGITAQALADLGYIVIAPTHLDSNAVYPATITQQFGLFNPVSSLHRTADVQFALDQVATLVAALPGYSADAARPVVAGHSHGAFTAALIVGAQSELHAVGLAPNNPYGMTSIADPRFAAAILLSPQGDETPWGGLSPTSWDAIRVPLLVVTGTLDEELGLAGWQGRLDPFGESDVAGAAVVYRDATHADIGGNTTIPGMTASIAGFADRFLDGFLGGDAAALAAFSTAASLMSLEQRLAQAFSRPVVGSTGTGVIDGGAGADILEGLATADRITGGGGADTLSGGAGADVFRYLATSESTASIQDTITDFQTGSDRIDLTALNPTSISIARLTGGSAVFAQTPGGAFQVFVQGSPLNATDIAYSGGFGVYVIGSDSPDVILGGDRPDPLVGLGGDDVITGGAGADAISGGAGRDVFRYVAWGDSNQTTGYDNLYDFTWGQDRIDLTQLNATSISILRSDNGSSFVYAETAQGVFLTTAAGLSVRGADLIYGPNGVGGFGIFMLGSNFGDGLTGTSQADSIVGGAGNDNITGGGGADVLFGNEGADLFNYESASDSTASAADTIFDFVSGADTIGLSRIRTGAADSFGIAYLSGGSYLFVDLGGNGTNDMVIGLANTTLRASDIIWGTAAIGEEPGIKDAGPEVLPVEDQDTLFDGDVVSGLSPMTGRWMLDLEGARGFHGQDWYL